MVEQELLINCEISPWRGGTDKTNLFRPKLLQMIAKNMNVCNWDLRYFLSTPPLLLAQPNKCDGRESTRLGAYLGSLCSSLH